MAYFVRTASERDVEAIWRLLSETWHATYDPPKAGELIKSWHSPASILENIERKDGEFLVADDGRRLGGLGFAAMSAEMTKTAILHQLYVHPSCQRQGIGREIFSELETCFPDAEIMRLEADPRNATAIAFCKAHGFTEVDRRRTGERIDLATLEKPLVRSRR